jgi:hypothetical protein
MPIVTIGTRRLYDALGVDINAAGEILQKVELPTGKTVTLYLGPNPPHGIMSLEGSRYVIPGRDNILLRTNYDAPCFLEITISFPREITLRQMRRLRQNDKPSQELLLRESTVDSKSSENLLDAISGVLGLRVHRQLVLKPLVESSFLTGEIDPMCYFETPEVEILEGLKPNSNTSTHIFKLLERMMDTSEDVLRKSGAILHFFLKAWREKDPISHFMYLFMPLEAILPSADNSQFGSKAELESLESIVKNSDAVDKEHLLQFLENAKTKFNPSLNSRFEEFAQSTSIPGWELDVEAFKKYNRMRNLLLHAGNKNIANRINLKKNTRTLEDLVERYVSVAILGSAEVYRSRGRPSR